MRRPGTITVRAPKSSLDNWIQEGRMSEERAVVARVLASPNLRCAGCGHTFASKEAALMRWRRGDARAVIASFCSIECVRVSEQNENAGFRCERA